MKDVQLNKKTPFVFKLSLGLMLVLMITFHMTGGLYARYTTTASGGDSARVAKFDFSIDNEFVTQMQTLTLDLAPGKFQEVAVSVKNEGEVALRCVVSVVNLTGNLPVQIEGASGNLQDGIPVTVSQSIGIGSSTTFNWKIIWPADEKDVEDMGKMDVMRITVAVEQVD